MPAQAPHGSDKPLCHLLPDCWISHHVQQIEQAVTTDALSAANNRACDVGEDTLPLISFKHGSCGSVCGYGRRWHDFRNTINGDRRRLYPPPGAEVYLTRGQFATGRATFTQLGKTPEDGWALTFLACRPDSASEKFVGGAGEPGKPGPIC
jgi:hypothetical protein